MKCNCVTRDSGDVRGVVYFITYQNFMVCCMSDGSEEDKEKKAYHDVYPERCDEEV